MEIDVEQQIISSTTTIAQHVVYAVVISRHLSPSAIGCRVGDLLRRQLWGTVWQQPSGEKPLPYAATWSTNSFYSDHRPRATGPVVGMSNYITRRSTHARRAELTMKSFCSRSG